MELKCVIAFLVVCQVYGWPANEDFRVKRSPQWGPPRWSQGPQHHGPGGGPPPPPPPDGGRGPPGFGPPDRRPPGRGPSGQGPPGQGPPGQGPPGRGPPGQGPPGRGPPGRPPSHDETQDFGPNGGMRPARPPYDENPSHPNTNENSPNDRKPVGNSNDSVNSGEKRESGDTQASKNPEIGAQGNKQQTSGEFDTEAINLDEIFGSPNVDDKSSTIVKPNKHAAQPLISETIMNDITTSKPVPNMFQVEAVTPEA